MTSSLPFTYLFQSALGAGKAKPACRPRHLKKANLIVNHDKSQFLI